MTLRVLLRVKSRVPLMQLQRRRPAIWIETVKNASRMRIHITQSIHDSVTLSSSLLNTRYAGAQRFVHVQLARLLKICYKIFHTL